MNAHTVMQGLRKLSRERGIDVQRLLTQYGIERFLARLAASHHGDAFVLKGAQLLRLRLGEDFRPTRDIDLLGYGASDPASVRAIMQEVASIELDDALRFDPDAARVETIRDQAEYAGVRAKLVAYLERTRLHVQIDVGYGDATSPPPERITVPSLLFPEGPSLHGYRLETVVAEKLECLTRLGLINGRLKDYYDLYRLSALFSATPGGLSRAIRATFDRRGIQIDPMPEGLTEAFHGAADKIELWQAFLQRNDLAAPSLPEVCQTLIGVYGPALRAAARL